MKLPLRTLAAAYTPIFDMVLSSYIAYLFFLLTMTVPKALLLLIPPPYGTAVLFILFMWILLATWPLVASNVF